MKSITIILLLLSLALFYNLKDKLTVKDIDTLGEENNKSDLKEEINDNIIPLKEENKEKPPESPKKEDDGEEKSEKKENKRPQRPPRREEKRFPKFENNKMRFPTFGHYNMRFPKFENDKMRPPRFGNNKMDLQKWMKGVEVKYITKEKNLIEESGKI